MFFNLNYFVFESGSPDHLILKIVEFRYKTNSQRLWVFFPVNFKWNVFEIVSDSFCRGPISLCAEHFTIFS